VRGFPFDHIPVLALPSRLLFWFDPCFTHRYEVQFLDGNTETVSHLAMKKREPPPTPDPSSDEDSDDLITVNVDDLASAGASADTNNKPDDKK